MGLFRKKPQREGGGTTPSLFGAPPNPIDGVRSIQAENEAEAKSRARLRTPRTALFNDMLEYGRQRNAQLDPELRDVMDLALLGGYLTASSLMRTPDPSPFYVPGEETLHQTWPQTS